MKLFICKKRLILAFCLILLAGAVFGMCAGAVNVYSHEGERTVVIDAGHGGIDAGVHGIKTNVKESDINLLIAKYLRGYFADAGFNAVMTRTTQGGLYGTSTKGFKMRDMKKRKEIIEQKDLKFVDYENELIEQISSINFVYEVFKFVLDVYNKDSNGTPIENKNVNRINYSRKERNLFIS